MGKFFKRFLILGLVVCMIVLGYFAYQAAQVYGTAMKIASCASLVNNSCINDAAVAIAKAFTYKPPPLTACTSLEALQRLPEARRIDPNADLNTATGQMSDDPRVRLTYLMTTGYMTNFGQDADRPGEFGVAGIMPGVGETFKNIDEAAATSIAQNAELLAKAYTSLLQDADPGEWANAPGEWATALIAAVYNDHPGFAQRASNPGVDQKLKVYEQALDIMKSQGWSVDFAGYQPPAQSETSPTTSATGGTNSGASPPAGTSATADAGIANGNLDANKVPEPLRSIWIEAAKAEGLDPNGPAPGFLAATHLNENNGFSWANREIDGGEGAAAYASITKDSKEWRLSVYDIYKGIWPKTPNSSFQGPGQFDVREGRAWSTFGRDGDGDGVKNVYSFIDTAHAMAAYYKYLMETLKLDPNQFESYVKAAQHYNGQVSWTVGGGTINNPGDRFDRPQDLYAYQAGEIAKALAGGDRDGQSVLNGCEDAQQDAVEVAYGLRGSSPAAGTASFPLDTTQSVMKSNNGGCLVGVAQMCRAGHPYAAYDVMSPSTVPVISLTDGIVVSVSTDKCPGRLVSVYDTDKDVTVSYLHMSVARTLVQKGDVVKAGQNIGFVGAAAEGCGVAHLHIDAAIGQPRPGCKRENCPAANQAKFEAGNSKIDLGGWLARGYLTLKP